jgi:hypothetical protein
MKICATSLLTKNFFVLWKNFFKKRLTRLAGYGIIGGPFASAAGPFLSIVQTVQKFWLKFVQPVQLTSFPKCAWPKCEQIVNK